METIVPLNTCGVNLSRYPLVHWSMPCCLNVAGGELKTVEKRDTQSGKQNLMQFTSGQSSVL